VTVTEPEPAKSETYLPRLVDLFERPVGKPPVYVDEEIEATLEARTLFLQQLREAVEMIIGRLASYPHPEEGFAVEALAILKAKENRFDLLAKMPIVPRRGELIPECLCGLLELMLRAAESGARLGPVHFGQTNLPDDFWRSMRIAAKRGMTSHALLTIWASFGNLPFTEGALVDAFIVAKDGT
jgi:hypothetical protein